MIIARVTLRPLKSGDKDVLAKANSHVDEIGGDGEPSLGLLCNQTLSAEFFPG